MPGRLRNWINTVRQDLKEIGMSWEEAQECFVDREDRSDVSPTWAEQKTWD